MDREENFARYGYSSTDCGSKKGKQEKVSQRGLSVAQLEKYRLEEQQNKKVIPNFDLNVPTSPNPVPLKPPSPIENPIRDSKQKSVSQEGEKMIGKKRSYPFSLETPQAPSFLGKFDPSYARNMSKSDESDAINNGYTTHMGPRKVYISPLPERNSSELIRENGRINGDVLTLATPAPAPPLLRLLGQILCDFGYSSSQDHQRDNLLPPSPRVSFKMTKLPLMSVMEMLQRKKKLISI